MVIHEFIFVSTLTFFDGMYVFKKRLERRKTNMINDITAVKLLMCFPLIIDNKRCQNTAQL